MDFNKLTAFCNEACSIDAANGDDTRGVYVRIRCGTTARAARQQWKVQVAEKDAKTLKSEIQNQLHQLADSEYTLFMIEAVYTGDSGPYASVTLRKDASETEEYNSKEVAGVLAREMVNQSKVLRSSNEDLTAFASETLDKNMVLIETVARLTAENQVLNFVIESEQKAEGDSNMAKAIEMLAPMFPIIAERLAGKRVAPAIADGNAPPKQPSKEEIEWPEGDGNTAKIGPNGETPAYLVDQSLNTIDLLVHQYPELLTEERIATVMGWYALVSANVD